MNTFTDYIQQTGHSGQNWSLTSLRALTPGKTSTYETGQSQSGRHTPKKRKLILRNAEKKQTLKNQHNA